MLSRRHLLLFGALILLVIGQQQFVRISYANSVIVFNSSKTPVFYSPVHVNIMQGQTITIPIFIDNSESNQTWMVFGAKSSFPNTDTVNMSFDWMHSMLEEIPQHSNISHVYVKISVASNAQIGVYSGQVVVKLRTGVVAPYSSVDIPVTVVITVKGLVVSNLFSDWLDFSMVFIGCAVLLTSITLAVYIMKNIVRT